eukprot:scaffold47675_cov63-Phaeocystis_antarctica.AAC.2
MLHSSSRSAVTEPDLPRPRCTGAGMISPSPPLVGAMSSSSSSTRAARLRSKNGDTTSCPSPLHVGDTSSSSSSDVGRETAERVTSCPSSSRVGHTSSSSSLVAARLRRGTCGASSCPSPPLAGTRSSSSSSVRAARLRMRAVAAPSCPSPPRPGGTSSSSSSAGLRSANGCAWLRLDGPAYGVPHLRCGGGLRLRLVKVRGCCLQARPGCGRGPAPPRPLATELLPRGLELLRTHHHCRFDNLSASNHHLARVREGHSCRPHERLLLGWGTLTRIWVVRVLTHQPRARAPPGHSPWVVLPVEPFATGPRTDDHLAVDVAPAAVGESIRKE